MPPRPARVPVGPARYHLLSLAYHGLSNADVARLTGYSKGTISHIKLRGKTVLRETAEDILSVPIPYDRAARSWVTAEQSAPNAPPTVTPVERLSRLARQLRTDGHYWAAADIEDATRNLDDTLAGETAA